MKWGILCALTLAIAVSIVVLTSAVSSAQTRRGGGAHGRKPRVTKPVAKPAKDGGSSDERERERERERATVGDAGTVEVKTLDSGTRVLRFGEMEIEGRLRSPQIVYFLRRVRAEFAAEDLGHRSFRRELSETRNDPNF